MYAGFVALVLTLAGCTTHQLTREQEPPPSGADWVVVWIAAIGPGILLIVFAMRLLTGDRRPTAARRVVAGVLLAALLVALSILGLALASELRVNDILDGGDCREVPIDQRPRQLVQLSCTEGNEGFVAFVALYGVLLGLLPALLLGNASARLLRTDKPPWLAAIVTTGGAVGMGLVARRADGSSEWMSVLAVLVPCAVAAVLSWREIVRVVAGPSADP